MKSARSFFVFVLLNAAWLAAASYFIARHYENKVVEPRVQFVTNFVPVVKATLPTVVTNVVTATNDFRWAQLESEDYRAYITRLRAIGCPEQTVRDIIIADVDKMLAPRMQAASPRAKGLSYWQPVEEELWDGAEQKEALQQQRLLDFEKREMIRELLGVDLIGERLRVQGQDDYHGQRLGFLPEEKRAQVRLVLDQAADRQRALMEQIEDGDATAINAELARLREQKEAALTPLLTTDERKQYDLWFSDTAARVRESAFGMNVSEEEFLKLYELQRGYEAKLNGTPAPPGSTEWKEFQQQARAALGETRFAEWQRAQDPDYRELARVAARFKLPAAVTTELYGYKQLIEEQRVRLDSDTTLSAQQREAGFQAIAGETQRGFKEAMGEKAFRYYQKRTANPWVQSAR